MPIILRHKRVHRYRLIQWRDNVIPIPMLERMIRERLVLKRLPVKVIVALHGEFRCDVDGGTKWVFEPIMFREVDAVPTARRILVPDCGADDADGTFVDESAELSVLPQNVIVNEWSDVFLEDDFPAFSDPFWVCPFPVSSSDNFPRFVDDALSAKDVWDEEVTWDIPLRVISQRVVSLACYVGRRKVQMGFF